MGKIHEGKIWLLIKNKVKLGGNEAVFELEQAYDGVFLPYYGPEPYLGITRNQTISGPRHGLR